MASASLGFVLLVSASIGGGLYMTPMTAMKTGWSFEATWFLYSLIALVVLPWTTGLATCPGLLDALHSVDASKLFLTASFGLLWGLGCQLFGISISMVGNSLGFALILGLAATLGSLVPLIYLHPTEVGSRAGFWNFIGLGLAVVALTVTAVAGMRKERDIKTSERQRLVADCSHADASNADTASSFTVGIVVCVLSGVFSACLNLATSFGQSIADAAVQNGAAKSLSTNATYCVSITSGAVPNLAYCGYVVMKKGDFPFVHGWAAVAKSIMVTATMGILWFGSNIAYGVATTLLPGDLGTVVGWPIYIIGMIIFANVSGIVQGEWNGAGGAAKAWMAVGLIILCLAIVAVGLAG